MIVRCPSARTSRTIIRVRSLVIAVDTDVTWAPIVAAASIPEKFGHHVGPQADPGEQMAQQRHLGGRQIRLAHAGQNDDAR